MELDRLYAATRARIGATLRDVGPSADAVRVPSCPDWNVAQLLAHLAGTTAALANRDYPGPDLQAWVDGHVADRAGRSALDNWQEWDDAGPAFEQLLVAKEHAFGALLYDAIVHEDDINAALGRPATADPDGTTYALQRGLREVDHAARERGLGTLVATIGDDTVTLGEGEPEVRLTIVDRWEALRAFGSRRSLAQLEALGFVGDVAPWIQALPHDLPATDLVEPR
jgi:uncharacterized protein (TIGR03083 family)